MTIRQRGSVWWVDVTTPQGRVRKPGGTRKQALALELEILQGAEATLERVLNYTMKTRWSVVLSAGHRERYRKEIDRLVLDYGSHPINPELFYTLLQYYRGRGYADASVRDYLIRVQTAINHYREEGHPVPFVSLKKILKSLAPKGGRELTISKETEKQILQYLLENQGCRRQDLHDYFKTLFTLGSRRGETLALRVQDYNEANQTVSFAASTTKTKKPKVLPVDTIAGIFERLTRGKKKDELVFDLHVSTIKAAWRRIRRDLGIEHPEFVVHAIRHTVGTRVVRSSGLAHAQKILGHSDIKTTLRYTHLDLEDLRMAQSRL